MMRPNSIIAMLMALAKHGVGMWLSPHDLAHLCRFSATNPVIETKKTAGVHRQFVQPVSEIYRLSCWLTWTSVETVALQSCTVICSVNWEISTAASKNGCPTGILVRTCCTFFPFLAISNPSPSFRPIFPTFGSFGSFGWGAKACSAAPRQKTRPPKITAPFRPSFETQQSMTGGKAATAAPTPKIMVIKLSWIWMSSACPGEKGLLDRFFLDRKSSWHRFLRNERDWRGEL